MEQQPQQQPQQQPPQQPQQQQPQQQPQQPPQQQPQLQPQQQQQQPQQPPPPQQQQQQQQPQQPPPPQQQQQQQQQQRPEPIPENIKRGDETPEIILRKMETILDQSPNSIRNYFRKRKIDIATITLNYNPLVKAIEEKLPCEKINSLLKNFSSVKSKKKISKTDIEEIRMEINLNKIIIEIIKNNDDKELKQFLEKESINLNFFKNNNNPLLFAIKNNCSIKIIQQLLQNNVNVNFSEIRGTCPLSEAVIQNNREVFNLLIKYGANVNLLNFQKETPLLFLVKSDLLSKYYLSKFIDNNADVDKKDKSSFTLLTYLSKYNNNILVDLLLNQLIFNNSLIIYLITLGKNKIKIDNTNLSQVINQGYNRITVDAEDKGLNTPLMHACFEGCYHIVDTLLKYHADINKDNKTKNRAIFMAIYKNNIKICRLLLNTGRVEINHKNKNGESVMSVACKNDNGEMIDLLVAYHGDVNNMNIVGLYPIHIAAINDKLETMKALCTNGANINVENAIGNNCFILACINNNSDIAEYIIENFKVDYNHINYCGDTALHQCCTIKKDEMIKFLISNNKVDINIANGFGYTAFLILCKNNNTELVKEILNGNKPIDFNAKTYGGDYALFYAVYHQNMELIKLLLDRNTEIDMYSERSYRGNSCYTAFLIACSARGSIEMMKLFIDHGIDINRPNSIGIYPLEMACKSNKLEHVRYLLENGANPNVRSQEKTPLIKACERGNMEMIKLLVEHGADVNFTANDHRSPLVVLANDTEKRNKDIIQYIIDQGGDIYCLDNYGNCLLYLVKNTNKIDKEEVYETLIAAYKARNDYQEKNNDLTVFISNHDIYQRVVTALENHPEINTETLMQTFTSDEIDRAYLEACIMGNFDMIKRLFELVPTINVNFRETNGDTPLIITSQTGQPEIALFLLDHGADPNLICECGSTAIYVASFSYGRHESIELMKSLLEHGAKTDILCQYFISPLMIACKDRLEEVTELYLKHGADPNMQDSDGNTALHMATYRGNIHIAEKLLECDTINIDIQTKEGYTPLMSTCNNKHRNISKQLLNAGANIYLKNSDQQTAFHIACRNGYTEIIDEFFMYSYKIDLLDRDKHGMTAYHFIKGHGTTKYLKPFIDYEMNYLKTTIQCYQCHQKSDLSENAVYYLGKEAYDHFDQTKETHSDLIASLKEKQKYIEKEKANLETYQKLTDRFRQSELDLKYLTQEEIDILLIYCTIFMEIKLLYQLFDCKREFPEFPLNINAQDQDGNTALHYVSLSESEKWQFVNPLASMFLRQPDINPNIQNKMGSTPLFLSLFQSNEDISKILLQHGVDVNLPNRYNETPLMIGCYMRSYDVVSALIKHGADVNVQDTIRGDTALTIISKCPYESEILELLVKQGHADVNIGNWKGETPLLLSCFANYDTCVELLVEHGADINVQEKEKGYTPLMIVLENFNYTLGLFLCEHQANLELVNHQGDTALLLTCSLYNKYGSELLIQYGADTTVKNREGLTPKELVQKNNFDFIIGL